MQAAVGSHCLDCAKASRPDVQTRARYWNARQHTLVTYVIMAVNLAVFGYTTVSDPGSLGGGGGITEAQFDLGLNEFFLTGGRHEWYRLVTAGFLHFGVIHLAFNMLMLYQLGQLLERPLGRAKFALLYAASLLGGSFGVLILSDQQSGIHGGASGAVFGLFGAFVFVQLSRGQNPMQGGIGSTIAINLAFTFLIPGISRGAHVGGLLVGALCGWILIGSNRLEARSRAGQATARTVAVAALSLAMMAAAVWVANRVVVDGAFLNWN